MASSGGGSGFSLASPGYVEVLTSAGGPLENTQGTLLTSAVRTTSTNSPAQTNYNARGVVIVLDVTAASGTGGLTVQIKAPDPVTTTGSNQLHNNPTAVTATGQTLYALYPGASTTGGVVANAFSMVLPRSWFLTVNHGDGSGYTYDVGYYYVV